MRLGSDCRVGNCRGRLNGDLFFIAAAKWCRSNELRDGGRCLLSGQEGFKHVYVGYIQWDVYLLMTNASH